MDFSAKCLDDFLVTLKLYGLPRQQVKYENVLFKCAAANVTAAFVSYLLTDLFMSCFGLVIIFCHHKIKWDKRNYNSGSSDSNKMHMLIVSGIRREISATICHANVT